VASDIQEVIVKEMLFDPSVTTSEMAQKTGIKFRTLQRHISQLQAMGVVVRKDGRKDGYWEVVKNKYVNRGLIALEGGLVYPLQALLFIDGNACAGH